jgi:hypothetical protein
MKSARSLKIARNSALLLILVLSVPPAMAQSPTGEQAPVNSDLPDAAELLERIERYKTTSPEAAQWRRLQAQSTDEPEATLELLLLDLFGPDATTTDEQAQERLQGLIGMADARWSKGSLQLLRLMADHFDQTAELRRETARLQQQLELERRSHEETRAKLDAIRRIDQELERRDNGSGATGGC